MLNMHELKSIEQKITGFSSNICADLTLVKLLYVKPQEEVGRICSLSLSRHCHFPYTEIHLRTEFLTSAQEPKASFLRGGLLIVV